MFDLTKLEHILSPKTENATIATWQSREAVDEIAALLKTANEFQKAYDAATLQSVSDLVAAIKLLSDFVEMQHRLLTEKGIYRNDELKPKHGISRDENAEITASVHAEHGTSFKYHHTIIADGRPLGGSANDRVDVYSNEAEDWDARRTIHVLNGKVLDPQ